MVVERLLRLLAVEELQDDFFGEGVVLDAELLAAAQTVLEPRDGIFRAGYLHLVAARHHPHVGVLVFQTEDILIIDAVEGGGVKCIVEGYN